MILDNKSMDFFFLKRYDADVIINVVLQLIKQKLPKFVDATPYDIQVLTPMRKGTAWRRAPEWDFAAIYESACQ